jgi:hypothetical protein
MAREILSKRNFLDFESPDSAISGKIFKDFQLRRITKYRAILLYQK